GVQTCALPIYQELFSPQREHLCNHMLSHPFSLTIPSPSLSIPLSLYLYPSLPPSLSIPLSLSLYPSLPPSLSLSLSLPLSLSLYPSLSLSLSLSLLNCN